MITLPPKTHIWIAAGVTDLRRGFDGLSALVQTKLEQSPFSGHVSYAHTVICRLTAVPAGRLPLTHDSVFGLINGAPGRRVLAFS